MLGVVIYHGICKTSNDQYGGQLTGSTTSIDWLIVGGESGHKAQPMHPWWVQELWDKCQAAGVPFFFKQ
ncbi:DUF5131 family protein [Paenibacillus pedocola]|uniref:DUF5131 family protein n=1 Tax=Paenibacillus pedocola TaxID=3242193 RepID=UPI00350E369D